MYQSATRSMPSGLAWTKRMITSSRMRSVSASVAAEELVDRLDQRLGAERLAGVQAAVDPHDRLALGRELRGLVRRDALGAARARRAMSW